VTVWRVAPALDELYDQLNQRAPHRSRDSDGAIGDAAHAGRDSDHNPWFRLAGQSYVTARDFTHDPAGGLDCGWLADQLARGRDPRIKYVIWSRHIMAGAAGLSPWQWRPYGGANPHTKHLHLSVVADARALLRTPWQLTDQPPPREDDLTPEQDHMLRVIHAEVTKRLPNRRGPQGAEIPGGGADTVLGYAANADGFGYENATTLARIDRQMDELTVLLRQVGGTPADPQAFAAEVAADLARRLEGR